MSNPRGNLQKLALCLYSQAKGSLFLLPSYFPFFPVGQGPPILTSLPPLGWLHKGLLSFSELALDAKLAFSILH